MLVKHRTASKTGKELFTSTCVTVITLNLLYLPLVATGKPVCYIRETFDNGKVVIQQTDCKGDPKQYCGRFDSWKDANLHALLNSSCYDNNGKLTSNKASTHQTTSRAITCSTINLPTIISGSFDCPPNSDVSKGEACNFTCNDGFYPVSSDKAVCEYEGGEQGGEWSGGNFICHGKAVSSKTAQMHLKCNQWNAWGESEYKFIDTRMAWNVALGLCEADGANLASIESEQINDYVYNILTGCNSGWGAWIGLELVNGAWKWNDHTNASYRNWEEGQPNANPHKQPKVLIKTSNGKWNDNDVSVKRYALCERSNHSKR